MLAAGRSVWAQNALLQYNGGPFLETYTIYPLYYGTWTEAEIDAHHTYLVELAAYMSGENAPPEEQPVMKQYGVFQVSVAPLVTSSFPSMKNLVLKKEDVLDIISANQ